MAILIHVHSYLTMNASRIQLERAKQAMVEVNSADLHGNLKHSGIFKLSANVNVQVPAFNSALQFSDAPSPDAER
jgi:shikimate 5-dehydrogenase